MSTNTPPNGSIGSSTREALELLLASHDTNRLSALDAHLATLRWSAEALWMGRALADYEDQRGWRVRASARYAALLEQGKTDPSVFATLHYDLAELAYRWGEYDTMAAHLAAAQRALAVLDDWALAARDLRLAALLACARNDIAAARHAAQQALARADEHASWPEQAAALVVLSYALVHAGLFAEAAACTGKVIAGDQSVLHLKLRAAAIGDYGYALRRVQGDQAALPFYQQALEIHMQRRDPLELRIACANLGELYRGMGQLDDAEAMINNGIAALEQAGALEFAGVLFNSLGNLQVNRGDHATAAETYKQALIYAQHQGNRQQQAVTCGNLTEVYLKLKQAQESVAWRFYSGALALEAGNQEEAERALKRVAKFVDQTYLNHKRGLYQTIARQAKQVDLPPQTLRALVLRCGLDPEDAERHPKVMTSLRLFFPLLSDQESQQSPKLDLLSRSAALRRAARALPISRGDTWLNELTQVLDGAELLVLHPRLQRGYRVQISGIATNFQLHTLLADAIMTDPAEDWWPGQRPDPRVVAAARDQPVDPAADTVHAAFSMASWQALSADGTLDADFDTSKHMIVAEAIPADIPLFGKHRVLLIGPSSFPRAWNAGRRFPKLHADLRVLETLAPQAVRDWLTRIAAGK